MPMIVFRYPDDVAALLIEDMDVIPRSYDSHPKIHFSANLFILRAFKKFSFLLWARI